MSMKKIVSLFLCVAMIFAASALAESAITPGTYEGAGEGFDAAGIKVNVTLNEEGIEAIEVLENNETPSVGGAAMETLIPQIIEGQTLAVDAVAGATLSSNGLKAAVADALTAAGLDPTTCGYEEVSTELLPPCMLIKEVEPEEEDYRSFYYTTQGNTCSDHITFSIKEDDMTVHNLVVYGGCSGTAAGFGALCEGQTVDYCVERMEGILCHGSNGSSCPDQSAKALAAAKGLIDGTLCDNCGAAE